jgi:hypothetical protein
VPYRRVDGLRLRPVPELGMCLAFVPHPPRLHTLNPAAWLIAELCDGIGEQELAEKFLSRSMPALSADAAAEHLASGLRQLRESGIITLNEFEES